MTAKKVTHYAVHQITVGNDKGGLTTLKAGAPIEIALKAEDVEALTKSGAIETAEQHDAREKRSAEHVDAVAEADRINREGRSDLPGAQGGDARPFTRREVPGMGAREEKKLAEAGDGGEGKNTGKPTP